MPFDAPFNLGPFEVDALGHISPRIGEVEPGFIFAWRGRSVHARLTLDGADSGQLVLRAGLGRIPSSVLTPDSEQRLRSFATLRALPRSLPNGWQMRLTADHRLQLQTDMTVGLPITATALVTDLSRFLLDLTPYLELLDEIGVTPTPVWAD